MTKSKKPKPEEDFEAVARRLECDDDKGRFEQRLRQAGEGEARA